MLPGKDEGMHDERIRREEKMPTDSPYRPNFRILVHMHIFILCTLLERSICAQWPSRSGRTGRRIDRYIHCAVSTHLTSSQRQSSRCSAEHLLTRLSIVARVAGPKHARWSESSSAQGKTVTQASSTSGLTVRFCGNM
jgi:hypothetical protein